MDVLVARIVFPNDPNNRNLAHQMFVANYISGNQIEFYSISSILGKERRIFDQNGDVNEEIFLITNTNQTDNNFNVPSFIDCSKGYIINLDNTVDIYNLNNRTLDVQLCSDILNKINYLKSNNRHTLYSISLDDFKKWNNKI